MVFNTFLFAIFICALYPLYLILSHKWQNRLLLIGSYIFYGAWDYRFLSLIFISTVIDFYCGKHIETSNNIHTRKAFLAVSVISNLSLLCFFKYFNFFADNFRALLEVSGFTCNFGTLEIILPVGISFYTFQTMSYTIDIYKNELRSTDCFLDFALFVSFFPQLVAGPIERARELLPQILSPRKVNLSDFYTGCHLIFWGLFQKVFIADNLAQIVDRVFDQVPLQASGIEIVIATYAFAFQIFCDFAGYSNIARGLGRIMGFDIMVNFRIPYIASNPTEFWKRWHISLSSWLKDYLYIPLGGSRGGLYFTCRNLLATMIIGGLWHGAAWTFIIWGFYHGFLLIIYRMAKAKKFSLTCNFKAFQFVEKGLKIFLFFNLVCIGWLFFRAQSIEQITEIAMLPFINFLPNHMTMILPGLIQLLFFTLPLLLVQYFQHKYNDLMIVTRFNPAFQTLFYVTYFHLLVFFGVSGGNRFIYFQF
ncbi:MAG: membrane-bound O-acyltransferase family protein [Candidatus Wallbacteria bacterium HGW-Wallbacteria-1]|uniref:Membrane-bound O-acyltransferase family protein n=1 Tax=Candidatus Wallbacteria bacterium HGW-Wallbacteria-1 TaxID=2013854 RepID=A0A2N1PMY7_9BACT|nr:MAG: membrane-bound O-acyltransferase family protein [Candidatus Wallbacteria bacterium HGW-Wallbacteria-1]